MGGAGTFVYASERFCVLFDATDASGKTAKTQGYKWCLLRL